MTAARLAVRTLLWAGLGLLGGMLVAIAAPLAFGARPYTVLSGSMEPAIGAGDAVVGKRIKPLDARVGDIVTFSDPRDASRLITHRVRSIRVRGTRVHFVTKGDANNSVERWRVDTIGDVSRVAFRLPLAGRVLAVTKTPAGRIALVLVPLLLLGAHEIVRVWRPRQEEASPEAAA